MIKWPFFLLENNLISTFLANLIKVKWFIFRCPFEQEEQIDILFDFNALQIWCAIYFRVCTYVLYLLFKYVFLCWVPSCFFLFSVWIGCAFVFTSGQEKIVKWKKMKRSFQWEHSKIRNHTSTKLWFKKRLTAHFRRRH